MIPNIDAITTIVSRVLRIDDVTDAAEALAKRALAANPLDGRVYRVLADVASARGHRERQQALIALAVQHAPRDIAARAWAAQIAIERGDAAAAVAHYDRILRVAPKARTEVFTVLAGLAATPGAREAMVSRVAEQPPWRTKLLGTSRPRRPLRMTCHQCSRACGPEAVSARTIMQRW